DAHSWINTPYSTDDRTDMKFYYKSSKPKTPGNIYLDLFGDSTRVLEKNDTIAYYYSKCSSFSIKFNPKDPNDMYGESQSQISGEVPLEILFLKRDTKLFMLTLSCKKANTDLNPNMLYDL